jgi:hypothetical protein
VSRRPRLRAAGLAWLVGWGAGGPAEALIPTLTPEEAQGALQAGVEGLTKEDFEEEWAVRFPGGEAIVVSTPFSRLALVARRQAYKGGEPLTEKQIQEQVDRGKDRIQLLVTLFGSQHDFARWYQPVLVVGNREVKATFVQNERSTLRQEDGRFAARNVYVFPLEGLPPNGTVTLVVRTTPERKEVFRGAIELGRFR